MLEADALKVANELDRAARVLNGYREQTLDYQSSWDSWYFPEDKMYLLSLFVSNPQTVFEARSEDARYGYKTKGNHPRERYA